MDIFGQNRDQKGLVRSGLNPSQMEVFFDLSLMFIRVRGVRGHTTSNQPEVSLRIHSII